MSVYTGKKKFHINHCAIRSSFLITKAATKKITNPAAHLRVIGVRSGFSYTTNNNGAKGYCDMCTHYFSCAAFGEA